MKDIKLLTKLIGGFVLVALIVVGVGYFGVTGVARLSGQLDAVGKVGFSERNGHPADAAGNVGNPFRGASPSEKRYWDSERQSTYQQIGAAKKDIDAARQAYNSIPKSPVRKGPLGSFQLDLGFLVERAYCLRGAGERPLLTAVRPARGPGV